MGSTLSTALPADSGIVVWLSWASPQTSDVRSMAAWAPADGSVPWSTDTTIDPLAVAPAGVASAGRSSEESAIEPSTSTTPRGT